MFTDIQLLPMILIAIEGDISRINSMYTYDINIKMLIWIMNNKMISIEPGSHIGDVSILFSYSDYYTAYIYAFMANTKMYANAKLYKMWKVNYYDTLHYCI